MRQIKALMSLAALATGLGGAVLCSAADNGEKSSPALGETMPAGYRDWKLISVAHEEGSLNDIRAILGNEIATHAYRNGTLPFPDGAIVARLAWRYVPSDENNKVFGHTQSFVAGTPTNVQFMVKDSKQYASTGGWGFVQFNDGKPAHMDATACFSCHVPVKDRDFVFTRYSP
jgi:Cytochrome P460